MLKPFLLRRVKEDVEKKIPAKQEIVLYAPLSKKQRELQEHIIKRTIVSEMDELAKENGVTRVLRLEQLLLARHMGGSHSAFEHFVLQSRAQSALVPVVKLRLHGACGRKM